MPLELVVLPYSPWSERARWALDHHGLRHTEKVHTPMLGELPLRLRTGRWSTRATVPVLVTPHGAIVDSTAIADWADRVGKAESLFPEARRADVLAWVARADRALEAGRNLVTRRTARSRQARLETLPGPLAATGPLGDAMARVGVAFFVRKYELDAHREEDDVATVAAVLRELRAALAGRDTLLDGFTYADVAASGVLQLVEPLPDRHVRLGPATRSVWATPELRRDFADLVEYRDALYARHRGKG